MWSDEWVGENSGNNESEEVAECVGIPASKRPFNEFFASHSFLMDLSFKGNSKLVI